MIFLAWVCSGVPISLSCIISSLASKFIPRYLCYLIMPAAWVFAVWVCQEFLGIPIALCPLLSYSNPELLVAAKLVGFYGVEFLIVFVNSALFAALVDRSMLRWAGLLLAFLVISLPGKEQTEYTKNLPIYGVQPAISHEKSNAASWSLFERERQEQLYFSLTEEAAMFRDKGLIVWPEGGNGMPIAGLLNRISKYKTLSGTSNSEFLLASHEFFESNAEYNTLLHFRSGNVVNYVVKSNTAPIVEANLGLGSPAVITAQGVRIGLGICYEALFQSHFRKLSSMGINALIVVTDDSSLKAHSVVARHAAYAIAFSVLLGKPVFFMNNNGLSLVASSQGRISNSFIKVNQPKVLHWEMLIPEDSDNLSVRELNIIPAAFILMLILVKLPADSSLGSRVAERVRFYFLVIGLLLVATLLLFFERSVLSEKIGFQNFFIRNSSTPPDLYSPLYKQKSQYSCGAAAVAYALTKMGDIIFEADVMKLKSPSSELGYSMLELAKIAKSRGFMATGIWGEVKDLPVLGDNPAIAHYKKGHFVVVLFKDKNKVYYYDPAQGMILNEAVRDFKDKWSGAMLKLAYENRINYE